MPIKRILYSLVLLSLLVSCSTKKNTVVTRAYHNLTARYNGYYYSSESIDEGVFKIERAHRDNYERVLPVYVYPGPDKAKLTFPEFDKAIKKSSLCIQRHAIKDKKGNEIASAGKWIDNNWINIGIAHFYKREFFSGIEAFEYVTRTYSKSEDKYTAMLWLIKSYNEIGSVSSSDPIISFLKNDRALPAHIKRELPVVWADYYMRRGQNTEAIARLMEATRNTNFFHGIKKARRARYSFIIGQLSEQSKDYKRAVQYYKRTIKLKPNYEMVFYSKIKIARLLDVKRSSTEKTKKDLLKMTKEFKNTDYYDVIYFTLGEIEEKERNTDQAVKYYQRSVQTSVSNPSQKASSYLKLAEISFARAAYEPAGAYYDSAVVTLPKDHPDYNSILARKKTLETLVGHIRTISREDSLQKVAAMPEAARKAHIDKLIDAYVKEKEKLASMQEEQRSVLPETGNEIPGAPPGMPGMGGQTKFYFYNPSTVSMGVADFTRRWGNRKLEDHWRRSNKALVIEDESGGEDSRPGTAGAPGDKNDDPRMKHAYYERNLPLNDTARAKSDTRIVHAYYQMGTLYKEELQNNKKTISTFEELNTRYPDHKYALNTYYSLYRTYLLEKNQERAEYYKNKILTEFPTSEFALLIKNPEIAEELNSKRSEVEAFYTETYNFYKSENYPQALSSAKEGISKFGKNEFLPKFEFIKSMSLGRLRGIDTLEHHLKLLVAKHPTSEVTPLAEDVLLSIKKQKNPELFKPKAPVAPSDTFNINMEAEHYIIAVTPDNTKLVDGFKQNVGNFNSVFFSEKTFTVTSNLFGTGKQIVTIKSFPNGREAMSYYDYLMADPDVFKGDIKKDVILVYAILPDNIPLLYQKRSAEAYAVFFEDNYRKGKSKTP